MNASAPQKCRRLSFRLLRAAAGVLVLAVVGAAGGCSSWSLSGSPGKLNGLFSWKGGESSLRTKVEADKFPSAEEVGLKNPRGG
jgi:hypothetical protein